MARVLVADDEADIRSLVRVSLELDGHDVVEATDGIEALRAMGPPAPDVVVLDVTMPRLDGWEVLVRLKTKGPTASTVPVILLTALDAEVDRIRGGIEGAVRYVTKPFDPDHLRAEVTRALDEPEPASRREAARRALERLAVLERGGPPAAGGTPVAHPHLTRLGPKLDTGPARSKPRRFTAEQLASLSERQRELVAAVGRTASVLAAAEDLGVSRSNVYASLRRIARRLNVATVTELVVMARQGSADAGD